MDRPLLLNLLRLGNDWLLTNGKLAADGNLRFPDEDPAEEVFVANGPSAVVRPPSQPSAPRFES